MTPAARRILIGVHVTESSQGLAETLTALHETTAVDFGLLVLADPAPGEVPALALEMKALRRIARTAPPKPGGAPASFNQLLAHPADIYVFLESGTRPAPDWLEHLLAALDADPANGLAGPSTNHCWNEQSVAPACGPSAREVEVTARDLLQRFGQGWRSMAPLHSLSDFCLAVRADVLAAVGAADIAYGRGPCWEMDYAARAARAGFRGVWAQAAFVRRGPMPAWRVASEPVLLEAGKRLYQDRFCGRRAAPGGADGPYFDRCAGEACADFAPAGAVRIQLPLPTARTRRARKAAPPLISCVMPTRGRPAFVAQSIAYFRRQDYPNRELLIVYDDEADLPECADGPGVRTLRATQRSVGAKRNQGVAAARGEIIAHWDDDDWYAPSRLSWQARPILQGLADITGLNDMLFMVMGQGAFWSVTRPLFARLFMENVSGGTLMFRREVWDRSGPYPAISLREDADFMVQAMGEGARLCRLPGRDQCVYVRHGHNTWRFAEGRYLQADEWSSEPEPAFMAPDRAFYFGAEEAAAPTPAAPTPLAKRRSAASALVSCIMPTANRRAFVPRAIRCFLDQDYPNRELIVIDDGQDGIADLIPRSDLIRYRRLDARASIGAKRNMACEMARGETIAHWDDDDWMAPQWLRSQMSTLTAQEADVCGLDKVFFYAPDTRQGWRYVYDGAQPWVCGGTLCYTKDLWRRIRFGPVDVGEDNLFVWSPQPKRMAINARHDLYVATVHRGNTSPKLTNSRRWHSFPASRLEQLMQLNARPASLRAG